MINAPLMDAMMVDCVMLDRHTVSDGMGGIVTTWEDGAEFKATITRDNTLQARVAEKQGVTETYTICTATKLPLEFHDVLRRKSDGATFRVTSNSKDSTTPGMATFQFGSVSAERWDVT